MTQMAHPFTVRNEMKAKMTFNKVELSGKAHIQFNNIIALFLKAKQSDPLNRLHGWFCGNHYF